MKKLFVSVFILVLLPMMANAGILFLKLNYCGERGLGKALNRWQGKNLTKELVSYETHTVHVQNVERCKIEPRPWWYRGPDVVIEPVDLDYYAYDGVWIKYHNKK